MPNPISQYFPGKLLESGSTLLKRLNRISPKGGHYNWELRCPCGDTFERRDTTFTWPDCLCEECAPAARVNKGNIANQDMYRVGMVISRCELLALRPNLTGGMRSFDARCLDCGDDFIASRKRIAEYAIACQGCHQKAKEGRPPPRGCRLCEGQEHRVEGEFCRNPRCGLKYAPLPKLRAICELQSNAARGMEFAL